MLPESLQARLLTDLVYNKPVSLDDPRKLSEPYATCFTVLRSLPPDERMETFFRLGYWHDDIKACVQQIQALNVEAGLVDYDEDWADAMESEPPISWLWENWLPRRHVSILLSYGGIGKSYIALDWIARWLMGRDMPDGGKMLREKEHIVFCDGEDFMQEYAARTRHWQSAGLWPNSKRVPVYVHRRWHKSKQIRMSKTATKWRLIDFADPMEQDRLVDLVYRKRPDWLIIDSVTSTFADFTFDKDVREPLGFITALTDEYDMACTLIHHYNKNQGLDSPPDLNNMKGAGAFANFCRSIFTLHYERVNGREVDVKKDPRIIRPMKSNFGKPNDIGVWFLPLHPAGVKIEYCSIEEIYALAQEARQKEEEQNQVLIERCADWLGQYLAKNGPTSRNDLISVGKKDGYAPFIIDRAKDTLGDLVKDTKGKRVTGNKWELAKDEGK